MAKQDAQAQQLTIEELQKQADEFRLKLQEIEKQKQRILNQNYFDVVDFAKSKNITKEQLFAFISNLIEEEKILVVYRYTDENGQEQESILRENARGQNVFVKHCKDGKLTKEQALTYARNEAGKEKVNDIFSKK